MEGAISHSFVRHTQHSSSISSHDSSVSSVASGPPLIPPPSGLFSSGPSQRIQAVAEPLPNLNRSPVSYNSNEYKYHNHYGTSTGSPSSIAGSSLHEPIGSADHHYGSAGISPNHLSGPGLSAQKRAYRQRRKDPSCDACRERKVKCDATETSSCSECTSRTVKCQFTKETNRRMSSIKQVQDLQNQLQEAKQQISHLRSLLHTTASNNDINGADAQSLNLPALSLRVDEKGHGQSPIPDFDHVRKNIRTYSRGLFKPPALYRQPIPSPVMTSGEVTLPARHVTDNLIAQFYNHIHRHRPFLHWSSFMQQVERVYQSGSFQGTAQVWTSMFFGVLACGTLQSMSTKDKINPEVDGMKYMVVTSRLLNTWTDNLLLDHARASLLLSIFLSEMNIRTAGWAWLGSSIRCAMDMGLHQNGPWPPHEIDARRRVYWAIFAYDRQLTLDGRPLQIWEEESDVSWPSLSDEQWLMPHGALRSQTSPASISTMSVLIPVIRVIPQLKKTLKSRTISRATLQTYDDYFRAIMSSYPEPYQTTFDGNLEPYALQAVFPLQTARFILYRHNMSAQCQRHERTDAINRCYAVAQDTTKYVSRILQTPQCPTERSGYMTPPTETLRDVIRGQTDNFTCKHLWRCTLILALRGDFGAALTLVRVSSMIGDVRKLNIACGRYLAFFLEMLAERRRRYSFDLRQVEMDEEMLAYASGDEQGDSDNCWVWAGADAPGANLGAGRTPNGLGIHADPKDDFEPRSALLTEKEINDWGGWERVERMLGDMMDEQERSNKRPHPQSAQRHHQYHNQESTQQQQTQPPPLRSPVLPQQPQHQQRSPNLYHEPVHNPAKRLQLSPREPVMMKPPPASVPPPGAARISIANII